MTIERRIEKLEEDVRVDKGVIFILRIPVESEPTQGAIERAKAKAIGKNPDRDIYVLRNFDEN